MYSYETRIRYTECDNDRKLSLTALVDQFQDCSTFHSEDAGIGLDYMKENGAAWFLLNWQIEVERMPEFCETVKVCTCPYDFKGFYGMRNFWIEDKDGNMIVKANSIWAHMDIVNGRPKKLTQEHMDRYMAGKPIDMEYADRKLKTPDEWDYVCDVTVVPEMIDTNNHVNNGQYIRMAMNTFIKALDSDKADIEQMLAEYKKSAKLGDIIRIYTAWQNGRFYVDLRDNDDNTYAVVALRQKAKMF